MFSFFDGLKSKETFYVAKHFMILGWSENGNIVLNFVEKVQVIPS